MASRPTSASAGLLFLEGTEAPAQPPPAAPPRPRAPRAPRAGRGHVAPPATGQTPASSAPTAARVSGGPNCICGGRGQIEALTPASAATFTASRSPRGIVVWSWWRSGNEERERVPGDCYVDLLAADSAYTWPELKTELVPCPSCQRPDAAIDRILVMRLSSPSAGKRHDFAAASVDPDAPA